MKAICGVVGRPCVLTYEPVRSARKDLPCFATREDWTVSISRRWREAGSPCDPPLEMEMSEVPEGGIWPSLNRLQPGLLGRAPSDAGARWPAWPRPVVP